MRGTTPRADSSALRTGRMMQYNQTPVFEDYNGFTINGFTIGEDQAVTSTLSPGTDAVREPASLSLVRVGIRPAAPSSAGAQLLITPKNGLGTNKRTRLSILTLATMAKGISNLAGRHQGYALLFA